MRVIRVGLGERTQQRPRHEQQPSASGAELRGDEHAELCFFARRELFNLLLGARDARAQHGQFLVEQVETLVDGLPEPVELERHLALDAQHRGLARDDGLELHREVRELGLKLDVGRRAPVDDAGRERLARHGWRGRDDGQTLRVGGLVLRDAHQFGITRAREPRRRLAPPLVGHGAPPSTAALQSWTRCQMSIASPMEICRTSSGSTASIAARALRRRTRRPPSLPRFQPTPRSRIYSRRTSWPESLPCTRSGVNFDPGYFWTYPVARAVSFGKPSGAAGPEGDDRVIVVRPGLHFPRRRWPPRWP